MRWLFAAALLLAAGAAAADDYPSRSISFVVPYAAGGSTDLVARLIGQRLEQRLGKPVVVENRPGAGTVLAATYVARQPADGYTLMLATSSTMAINVSLYKSLPYDPVRDLTPVATLAGVPFILVVNNALPVRSIADLVGYAKAHPDTLTYASNGHGGAAHLFAELFKTLTGITATHIPYKGNAPALNDVIAGHVSMAFGDFGTTLPLVRAGNVRALGESDARRMTAAPEIAPLADAVPGFDATSWQMAAAPAGLPPAILERLNTELRAIVAEAQMADELAARGLMPMVSPPAGQLPAFVTSEIARWAEVVRHAGVAGSE